MRSIMQILTFCAPVALSAAGCATQQTAMGVAFDAGADGFEAIAVKAEPMAYPDSYVAHSAQQVADLSEDLAVMTINPPSLSEDDVLCAEQAVTGTHRIREICRTRAERDRQRRQAQEWLRSGGLLGGGTVVGGWR